MRHPHDHYRFEAEDKTLRILGNDVLVELDPTQDRSASGLIYFPDGAMEHVNQTGTIRAFGYHTLKSGGRIPIRDLAVGLKCVFVRFRKEQHTNLLVRQLFGERFILLKPSDLHFVYDAEDHDRVLA